MKNTRSVQLAAWLWISQIQYFLVQVVVALAWPTRYSWRDNFISDLGNTACGDYARQYVCSPLHSLMNVSFLVLGITMAVGAWLLRRPIAETLLARTGFIFLILAGLGTILVGIYPENSIPLIHVTAASLPFIFGNTAMILIGIGMPALPKWFRHLSIAAGLIALCALGGFLMAVYFGFGKGGTERIISYPLTIWMIIFGDVMIRKFRG